MQGLKLSRLFYEDVAAPILRQKLRDHWQSLAFGLVGEGSECFGFDDTLSRDHDFGAGFCIWAPQEQIPTLTEAVQEALKALPRTFMSFPVRMHNSADQLAIQRTGQRLGLFSVEAFYARFTHGTKPPQSWQEWYGIPEHFLSVATNGTVFQDNLGHFSAFRQALLDFYPEDVRKKKLASRLSIMAQSGQYNLLRLLQRGDGVGATLACARFIENALAAYFLMHKRYMPFYKWAFKAVHALPQGKDFAALLQKVLTYNCMELSQNAQNIAALQHAVEEVCIYMVSVLQEQALSAQADPWLMLQAEQVQSRIENPQIRAVPLAHGVQYS